MDELRRDPKRILIADFRELSCLGVVCWISLEHAVDILVEPDIPGTEFSAQDRRGKV